ncbi:MAG: ABC transporter substrate-binding protein [Hyphomicrobiales bacterium]|nr:ABC transporter substrate-binding protein [Hyphomicrobiales bacterium]
MLDRRTLLASLSVALVARPCCGHAAEPLTLWGPPAAPSIILAHAVASELLKPLASEVSLRIWRTPDEMRAGISSGNMAAVIVPTYVAANLHNRGFGIKLLNVMTDGLLYVVAPPGTADEIAGLKGKRVAVPFRNDMPDIILRRLLAAARLGATDLTIDYSGTPPEAVQMLFSGRVDAALLSEPASTAAVVRAAAAGKRLERIIDCQRAWSQVSATAGIPQAGLAVTDKLISRIGVGGIGALQQALESATQAVLANPAAAAAAASAFDLPAPVVERSIPFSNLVARPATSARTQLTAFFALLAEDDPRMIGGRQPGDGFYAL